MKVYVVVGENRLLNNISAHAVYSRREDAESHISEAEIAKGNNGRMWFADRAEINELELDGELTSQRSKR